MVKAISLTHSDRETWNTDDNTRIRTAAVAPVLHLFATSRPTPGRLIASFKREQRSPKPASPGIQPNGLQGTISFFNVKLPIERSRSQVVPSVEVSDSTNASTSAVMHLFS